MIGLMMSLGLAMSAAGAGCDQASNVEIENCQQRQLRAANDRLNAAYRARMAPLSPARRTQLRDAERRWMASRDARCKVDTNQGTLAPVIAADCLIDQTNARANLLARGQ